MTRITHTDLRRSMTAFTRALSASVSPAKVEVSLHQGNSSYKVPNRLVVTITTDAGPVRTQVWPDAQAGYTTRDAYNALRNMTSALSLLDN